MKYLSALFISSLFLTGCNEPIANCMDADSQRLVGKIITDGVEKIISNVRYSDTQEFVYDKAKIRASLEQVKFEIESVRTVKADPDSTKKFCSGALKMIIPTNILMDADTAREMEKKSKISQYARELNIDDSINVFTKKDIEYSVQPTDDGKELHVELDGATVWVNLLDKITSSALWKPILEVRKANEAQQNEQIKEQTRKQLEELQEQAIQKKLETEKLKAIQDKQNSEKLKQDLVEIEKSQLEQSSNNSEKIPSENDCYKLWYQRNLVFAKKGYCFDSKLGKNAFREYSCFSKNVKMSAQDKQLIENIKNKEQQINCKIDTNKLYSQ
jgi:hypothetical protein